MNRKMTGSLLVIAGLLLVVAGIFVWKSAPKAVLATPDRIPENAALPAEKSEEEQNKAAGLAFEEWVVQRFSPKYFSLLSWAGDKSVAGRYPEANMHPDLLYNFELHGRKSRFAVECKWRRGLYKGGVEWTYPAQLARYQAFAQKEEVPVFLVLGLGGNAGNPERVFVAPIKNLSAAFIPFSELSSWEKKDKAKEFFFEPQVGTLR